MAGWKFAPDYFKNPAWSPEEAHPRAIGTQQSSRRNHPKTSTQPLSFHQVVKNTKRISKFAAFDRDPVERWSFGHVTLLATIPPLPTQLPITLTRRCSILNLGCPPQVTLLGDAAHPLLPFGSQAGNFLLT
jgi:2-polyprenyl-6-methoxyphenol hydroxylase-like FAD-dependent oxidoreductase